MTRDEERRASLQAQAFALRKFYQQMGISPETTERAIEIAARARGETNNQIPERPSKIQTKAGRLVGSLAQQTERTRSQLGHVDRAHKVNSGCSPIPKQRPHARGSVGPINAKRWSAGGALGASRRSSTSNSRPRSPLVKKFLHLQNSTILSFRLYAE